MKCWHLLNYSSALAIAFLAVVAGDTKGIGSFNGIVWNEPVDIFGFRSYAAELGADADKARRSNNTEVSPLQFGAICDGVADDTKALSDTIDDAETSVAEGRGKVVKLPIGTCLTGPLAISGQLSIVGVSSYSSVLKLKPSINEPLIRVKTIGEDFSAKGFPFGEVRLENFRLTSSDGKYSNTSSPNAQGILLEKGSWGSWVRMTDVTIWNMPGSGLLCDKFQGLANLLHVSSLQNGGDGLSVNTCQDWRIIDSSFYANDGDGIKLSGAGQFEMTLTDSFENRGNGLHIFGYAPGFIQGGILDSNGKSGLFVQDLNPKFGPPIFQDVAFYSNSNPKAGGKKNAYPNIEFFAGSGEVIFVAPRWSATNGNASYSVMFTSGSLVTVKLTNPTVLESSTKDPMFTNAVDHIR